MRIVTCAIMALLVFYQLQAASGVLRMPLVQHSKGATGNQGVAPGLQQLETQQQSQKQRHNLHSHLHNTEGQQQQSSENRKMHSQSSQLQHQSQKQILSHNFEYLKHHFHIYNPQTHQLSSPSTLQQRHNLYSTSSHNTQLLTYKLQPNVFSFTLPLTVAGYQYQMGIDSGSSDIWIKGEDADGQPKERFKCGSKCTENLDEHKRYRLGYLDGRLSTYEIELEVELKGRGGVGGDQENSSVRFNESVLVAFDVDGNFEENQGLIGLSFPELATNPHPTFIQTLQNQGLVEENAFGVNLNFQNNERCFITFGAYDQQLFEDELNFYKLTSRLFYYINVDGVSIGKSDVGESSSIMSIRTGLLDTGNTCVSIPNRYQEEILRQFNTISGEENGKGNENRCFFDKEDHAPMFSVMRCRVENVEDLPTLNIHIEGKRFQIEKEFFLQGCDIRPRDEAAGVDGSIYSEEVVYYCDTYIESVRGMYQLFLGDGFFNRYYTYFDLQRQQVGIAKNKEHIEMQTLIENSLNLDEDDWLKILTRLNPEESKEDIEKEINTKFGEKNSGSGEITSLWDVFISLFKADS